MKSGFYLSPCGKHIIEITMIAQSRFGASFDIEFKDSHMRCDGEAALVQWRIILSGWQRLGL